MKTSADLYDAKAKENKALMLGDRWGRLVGGWGAGETCGNLEVANHPSRIGWLHHITS